MMTLARQDKQQIPWINETTAAKFIPTATNHPHVDESEHYLVGTILSAGEVGRGNLLYKSVPFVQPHDFYNRPNGLVWRAMQLCVEQGLEISLTSVRNQLTAHNALGTVGEGRLETLIGYAGTNVESFAHEVFQAAICRLAMYQSAQQLAFAQNGMKINITEFAMRLGIISQHVSMRLAGYTQRDEMTLHEAAQMQIAAILSDSQNENYIPGFPTGFVGFDKVTLGLILTKLYLLAAPQGWGKTALMLNLALAMLRLGIAVKFISLEMTREDIVQRLITMASQVDDMDIKRRVLTPSQTTRIKRAKEELFDTEAAKQFVVQRMSQPSLDDLDSSLTNAMMGAKPPQVVFIDWFGMEKITFPRFHEDNQAAGIAFKKLEKWKETLGPAFVVACQMNTQWEKKRDKRPGLHSIRYGSRAVDAADFIGFIYHEAKVKKTSLNSDAELIVRKNRSGPGGENLKLMMGWRPETLTFSANSNSAESIDKDDE